MRKNNKMLLLILSSLIGMGSMVGCGTPTTTQAKSSTNVARPESKMALPPFQNLLQVEVTKIDPNYDPKPVLNQQIYSDIQVEGLDGQLTSINANKKDILFVAYWCPHCERTLHLLMQNRSSLKQFPTLVYVGYPNGTSFSQAKDRALSELKYFDIPVKNIYFIIGNKDSKYIPGFPFLIFSNQGKIESLFGEQSLSSWQKALNL